MGTAGIAALIAFVVSQAEDAGLPTSAGGIAALVVGLALAAAQLVHQGHPLNIGTVALNGVEYGLMAYGAPHLLGTTQKAAKRQVKRVRAVRTAKAQKVSTVVVRPGARPVAKP